MRDLRRLLRYLLPHTGIFAIATFAMVVGGVLESATGALIIPIVDQALTPISGHRTPTPFGLQRLIPSSGLAAFRTIALLLLVFPIVKGIAEYVSTYLMAYIGQSSILRLRQELYNHLLSQSAAFFERHRTNYLVSRLISSAAAIEAAVSLTLRDLLREAQALRHSLGADRRPPFRGQPHPLRLIDVLVERPLRVLAHPVHLLHALKGGAVDHSHRHEHDALEVAGKELEDGQERMDSEPGIAADESIILGSG